jgi:hypothetical protein
MKKINWHVTWKHVRRGAIAACGLAAVVFAAGQLPSVIDYWTWRSAEKHERAMIRMYEDSVRVYRFDTHNCSGEIKFKIAENGFTSRYRCTLKADSGFCFGRVGRGELHIKLVDKDGFVLFQFPISEFVSIKDPRREDVIVKEADGIAGVTLPVLLKTMTIEAPTTLHLEARD